MCGLVHGQPSPARPAFEVVSIRPGSPGSMMDLIQSGKMHSRIDDALLDLGSVSLSAVIQFAYRLPADRISGPGWLDDARFDILAKLPVGASKSQAPEMLQSMLAERFHFAAHRDQKVMPVYELMVGKGPLKLKESANDDSEPIPCEGGLLAHLTCHKVTLEQLANQLSHKWDIDRPVIDVTGLKGAYDFTMGFDLVAGGGRRGSGSAAGQPNGPPDPTEISLAEAVRRLGLRLEPARRTFDYLVIDHVDRVPTEN
ncbi:MAG: TIGR03435 family protein [Bryobacteraceae bacterium]